VATVDGAGNVTGVAPGTATITATAGARTGSAAISVCPDLAVGGVYTAVMPGAAGLCLAGGASGNAEYTYMPVNLSSSSSLSLTATATGIVAVTGPPTPDRIPNGAPLLGHAPGGLTIDENHHTRMMERDRRMLEPLMRSGVGRIDRARRAGGPRYLITPAVPTVGDLMNLNVAQGCAGALDTRVGQVRSVGQHVIVVSDTSNPAGGFTTAQYDSIALEFDSLAYAVDTRQLRRAHRPGHQRARGGVLHPRGQRAVAARLVGGGAGLLRHARPVQLRAGLVPAEQRGRDVLHAGSRPHRGGEQQRAHGVVRARQHGGHHGHELQHLINASRRGTWSTRAPASGEVWLNEGLSHIAEELVFYRTSVGLAPRGNIQLSTLTTGPNASRRVAAFNTYANQNFGR
jgi:hypothetical protein